MHIFKNSLSLFLCLVSSLVASDTWDELRIGKLLPQLCTPLAVEPNIPSDFVAMSREGPLDIDTWIYWGPKEVIEKYFRNPSSLQQSLLRVRSSETVKQIGQATFSCENDELCKVLAPLGLKRLFDVRMKWGKYPIYAITAQFEKKWLYAAWVGLSDPQGTTLLFELVYPGTKPTQKEFELWDLFLDNTKILPDPFYSDGFNISYAQGKTAVKLYGASFSLIGQQRYADKQVQIVADMQNSDFKCTINKVSYEQMVLDPTVGTSIAKVYLTLEPKGGKEVIFTHMIPVSIEPVDTFSIDKADVLFEQKLPCMLREYLK